MMNQIAPKRNRLVVGRAASGLYLILRARLPFAGAAVMYPANICHAAVYPALYAGWAPTFCDVDEQSGNVRLMDIVHVWHPDVKAVVLPHMYGNPATEIGLISQFCREKGVLLIEDCASAMGSGSDVLPVGHYGDYVVYSTGHAKTVDLGWGGMVCSDFPLEPLREYASELFDAQSETGRLEVEFGRVYRGYLNSRGRMEDYPEQAFFKQDFRLIHLLRATDEQVATYENRIAELLPGEIVRRRNRQRVMDEIFRACGCEGAGATAYSYREDAVPWRYNFFVKSCVRPQIVSALLAAHVPISDWYPPNADFFGVSADIPHAIRHGNTILNLPLYLTDAAARNAFRIIATELQREKR